MKKVVTLLVTVLLFVVLPCIVGYAVSPGESVVDHIRSYILGIAILLVGGGVIFSFVAVWHMVHSTLWE